MLGDSKHLPHHIFYSLLLYSSKVISKEKLLWWEKEEFVFAKNDAAANVPCFHNE